MNHEDVRTTEHEDARPGDGENAPVSSRRAVLVGLAAGAALAGCIGDDGDTDDGTGDDTESADPGDDTSGPDDDGTDGDGTDDTGTGDDGADDADGPVSGKEPDDYGIAVKGDPDAEVTLAVFSDFACPACAAYAVGLFPDLEAEYLDTGRIRYEHRDFPIPVADPGSWQAANAAREVYESAGTEAFWAYKLRLLERYAEIGDGTAVFADVADELDLDGDAIETAARERPHDEFVETEREHGVSLGIPGTPGFVVDGEAVTGETLEEVVDRVKAELDAALDGTESG